MTNISRNFYKAYERHSGMDMITMDEGITGIPIRLSLPDGALWSV